MGSLSDAFGRFFYGDPNRVDELGISRLQQAILHGDAKAVMRLIERGADVNLRAGLIFPPLHLALERDRQDIALLLMKAGADLNVADTEGRFPLHIAARQGQDTMIDHLIRLGAQINARDSAGRNALHLAAPIKMDVIQGLIGAGIDVNAVDHQGQTPLHIFLNNGSIVPILLAAGANPNARDHGGISPFVSLLGAAQPEQHQDVLRLMLRHGADLTSVNITGQTALHVFIQNGLWDLFVQAEEGGADLNAVDKRGNSLLHAAIRSPRYELAQAFCCRLLDKAPHMLGVKNNAGRTAFAELIDYGFNHAVSFMTKEERVFSLARTMLERGDDPSTQDDQGRTLLHLAVARKNYDLLALLVEAKANLDIRDRAGRSALSMAIQMRDIDLVDFLLDYGAEPNQTSSHGWTLLDLLAQSGDRDSTSVQRLIVGGGTYKKQLPLQTQPLPPSAAPPRPPLKIKLNNP